MSQEEVVKPDRWCIVEIFDAIEHVKAAVSRIDDRWFPTAVRLEISKHYISMGSDILAYSVSLNPQGASVHTRNCTLTLFPDVLYLTNHAANIRYSGKYLHVDPTYYYTGKEVYSAHELYTMISQIFEKAVAVASSIVNP